MHTSLLWRKEDATMIHTFYTLFAYLGIATVGERLRNFRMKRNMTIDALAKGSGISRDTIIHYENGQTEPSPENLLSSAKSLSVNVDKLCDEYYRFLLYPGRKRIIEISQALGLTQREFAATYDFPIAMIKCWEQGRNRVTREQWKMLKMMIAYNAHG